MKGEVINFEILRIESELDKYAETGVLPLIILDGVYSLDDICTVHYDDLSKKHQHPRKNRISRKRGRNCDTRSVSIGEVLKLGSRNLARNRSASGRY